MISPVARFAAGVALASVIGAVLLALDSGPLDNMELNLLC